ncbi:uncharacterized protein LOC116351404 [Contarinia nasturtii]|uniref:uncharacterized protein LOC116351400 n=1 Tax=Contarinia nasturtii TaxID=265458 RepID=UPI0012D3DF8E|nr:uncharacterized protein LOC116351400 [Contarinia nasturtii]XP_031639361.1 uncharacterized protein LOC116351404 [Contarinia nasturtii]
MEMNYRSLQREFRSLGCTDEAQTTASCQLYIELCEVRRKLNVKYYYNVVIDKIYMTVSNESGDAIESFYLAIPSSKTLDLTLTEPIQKELIQAHAHEINDPENVPVSLAIVDSSTTIAFYKLILGLSSLDTMKNKKQRARNEL